MRANLRRETEVPGVLLDTLSSDRVGETATLMIRLLLVLNVVAWGYLLFLWIRLGVWALFR